MNHATRPAFLHNEPPGPIARSLLLLVLCMTIAGCLRELRGSTAPYFPASQPQATTSTPAPELVRWLVEAFRRRGFSVIDQRTIATGSRLKFKGSRNAITTVVGNKNFVYGTTDELGSVFYVFISDDGRGRHVRMIGKPTVNNHEVCSDDDAFLDPCYPVYTGAGWAGRDRATGYDEVEVIQGVLVEMAHSDLQNVTFPPPPRPAPSSTAGPRCRASSLPQWNDADAVMKKKLLDYCHAPADSPDPGAPRAE